MRVLSSVKHATSFIIFKYDIRNEMGCFIWHPDAEKLEKIKNIIINLQK